MHGFNLTITGSQLHNNWVKCFHFFFNPVQTCQGNRGSYS